MATDERTERARRVMDGLRQGLPFDLIFPRREKVTPAPQVYADRHLDFVATTLPSPHGGTQVRSYLIDCEHGRGELSRPIPDGIDPRSAEDMDRLDGETLEGMLPTHYRRTGCQCWPKGWARVEDVVQ